MIHLYHQLWPAALADVRIDLDKLRDFKDRVVARMTGGLGQLSKARKVNYIRGRARFTSAQSLSIDVHDGGTQDLTFEHAVLATGSRPIMLPAFDISSDRIMDSTGALELADVPGRLLVVGGGIVGLELGQVDSPELRDLSKEMTSRVFSVCQSNMR